jgi:hypothetical protein
MTEQNYSMMSREGIPAASSRRPSVSERLIAKDSIAYGTVTMRCRSTFPEAALVRSFRL